MKFGVFENEKEKKRRNRQSGEGSEVGSLFHHYRILSYPRKASTRLLPLVPIIIIISIFKKQFSINILFIYAQYYYI